MDASASNARRSSNQVWLSRRATFEILRQSSNAHDADASRVKQLIRSRLLERRMLVLPWTRFFELRREPDNRHLVGLTADDLHRERKSRLAESVGHREC